MRKSGFNGDYAMIRNLVMVQVKLPISLLSNWIIYPRNPEITNYILNYLEIFVFYSFLR